MKTRIGYYYANAVYTDEDENGLFHTRYGKLTSTNRGCTKIEILDVNIGKKYFELLVCYPGKRDQKWTIYAGEVKAGNGRCGWRRNPGHLGFIEVTG